MRRLVLQLVAFVLLACASGCLTRGMAMSPGDRVLAEVYIAAMVVQAKLLPNAPGAPEGFEVEVLRELGTTTAVGLDVAPDGDVFVAVSNRLGGPEARGVSDNRSKPYWLLDDLAARTVDDRRAYIEKWASQGGDPLSKEPGNPRVGTGGPGWKIKCETAGNPHKHQAGALSMAHAGKDTGGSQFFIAHSPQPHLDGVHTVFGQVTEGLDVVMKIQQGDVVNTIRVS